MMAGLLPNRLFKTRRARQDARETREQWGDGEIRAAGPGGAGGGEESAT